jgi:hypothetical protein
VGGMFAATGQSRFICKCLLLIVETSRLINLTITVLKDRACRHSLGSGPSWDLLDLDAKRHTKCYNMDMKYFSWNIEKNELLKEERQISFEEVVFYIEIGFLLDVLEHPNQEMDKGQKIFVVQMDDYVYLVPFIEDEQEVFLKTIIPSRKATRKYLKGSEE